MFKKKVKNGFLLILALAAVSSAVSCNAATEQTDMADAGEIYEIQHENAEEYIVADGEISISSELLITPPFEGNISEVNKKVGEYVKKGDILFVYDTDNLIRRQNKLKEELAQAKEESEYQHEINKRNLSDAEIQGNTLISKAQNEINKAKAERERLENKLNVAVAEKEEIAFNMNNQPTETQKNDGTNQPNANSQPTEIEENGETNQPNANSQPTETQENGGTNQFNINSKPAETQENDGTNQFEMKYQQKISEIEEIQNEIRLADDRISESHIGYDDAVKEKDKLVQQMSDIVNSEKFSDKTLSIQADIDELQQKIDNAAVVSEISGIITCVNIEAGSSVQDEYVFKVAVPDAYIITAHVNEENIEKVSLGMNAAMSPVNSDKTFSGVVSKIYMVRDDASATYTVEIDINLKENVFIGQRNNVKIYTNEKRDAMMIPYNYLKKNGENYSVLKIDSDGNTVETEVKVGIKAVDKVEIISSSLKEGDKILEAAIE